MGDERDRGSRVGISPELLDVKFVKIPMMNGRCDGNVRLSVAKILRGGRVVAKVQNGHDKNRAGQSGKQQYFPE